MGADTRVTVAAWRARYGRWMAGVWAAVACARGANSLLAGPDDVKDPDLAGVVVDVEPDDAGA